jgi:hypothetical protein|tara:strand:+ start:162 stop:431 length:270 start_codon:yes stop_codon:yes gene_type:complete
MYIDEYQYTMEHSLVEALINSDVSGISDDEDQALDEFLNKVNERAQKEHGASAFAAIVMPQHAPELARCDVTGYRGDCYDVTALVYRTH